MISQRNVRRARPLTLIGSCSSRRRSRPEYDAAAGQRRKHYGRGWCISKSVRDCQVLQVAGQAEDVVGQRQRGKGAPEDRKECEIIGKLTKPSAKNHGAEKRDHVQKRLSDGA